ARYRLCRHRQVIAAQFATDSITNLPEPSGSRVRTCVSCGGHGYSPYREFRSPCRDQGWANDNHSDPSVHCADVERTATFDEGRNTNVYVARESAFSIKNRRITVATSSKTGLAQEHANHRNSGQVVCRLVDTLAVGRAELPRATRVARHRCSQGAALLQDRAR